MKTWLRSPIEQVCGRCCARISRGDIVQILSSPIGHLWKKARCLTCADGTPPELPALEDQRATIEPRRKDPPLVTIAALAKDWKTKASQG